ncbi:MAG: heavy-metal-associated domain-containing protein, partial [Burkholderiales bacterium]|nr:heavy-metal-associated domain-containing protein [Burkholderiales bacterium]
MSSIELDVRNMSCNTCVNHVTQALKQVAGVRGVQVDLPSGRVRVQLDDAAAANPAATPPLTTALVAALDAAGYPA